MYRKVLIIILILASISLADKVFIFHFVVYRIDDRVELKEFIIDTGTPTILKIDTAYSVKIISNTGKELYSADIPVSFFIESIPSTEELADESEQRIRLPFFADAERIEIYHNDNLIYSLDVKPYLCNNNGVCDEEENIDNCPTDCKLQKPEEPKGGINMLLIGALLIIVGIILLYFLIRRRNAAREAEILSRRLG